MKSNKKNFYLDHAKNGQFKDLNDCLRQHVYVSLQKVGQFPCPMCQVDENTGQVFSSHHRNGGEEAGELDQQGIISNLIGKNIDNSLYFDTYEMLRAHIIDSHPKFNVDNYFVCKQCGQVFLNRYKLSCHLFNVHSGKRKRRSSTASGKVPPNKVIILGQTNNYGQLAHPSASFNANDVRN